MSQKVIITCAVTGSIHTPTMSPYLPITPDEIIEASVGAAEAGAAIIHLHARDPETGKPSPDPKLFMQFLPRIKQQTDAVMNVSTGGGLTMSLEERLEAAHVARPELCSLNMGSMNFGLYQIADKHKDWQQPWERDYLEATRHGIVSNTFGQIERIISEVGGAYGTKFEFECYDVSHLYTLAHFLDRKLLTPPLFVQTIFGLLGGIGPAAEDLMHMRRTADKLFGKDYLWSVLAAGRHQMNLCTMGAIMGGNVRVGLEDSLYIAKGKLATSNAAQVAKIRHIMEELSLEIATADEARQMLDLKGGDQVGF
ncbi:3-keto-5-aminohexanoate cleavage protein [Pseudoxanthobacter sp. M-2]|uniref:3-keto-5-aminohexanoate cleavage protein n=1 Tax=Pseudoxanthobacter sp. M-2 TaxID=3078754 RepID=UPI0038FD32D3